MQRISVLQHGLNSNVCRTRAIPAEKHGKTPGPADAPTLHCERKLVRQEDEPMLNLLLDYGWTALAVSTLVLAIAVTIFCGTWMIAANQSGLVVKRFGPALASGRIIALNGEAGYQARLLSPGWHFGLWRWRYRVIKVPTIIVRPGEIALIVAADGAAMPNEHVLGKSVPCDDFQDGEAFLSRGGERGRQLAMLTAGTYRINPALFEVVMTANASKAGMSPNDLRVYQVQPERVGIVTALDGRPITAGDLAGPIVPATRAFSADRRSSTRAAAAVCRKKCCCPVRGT
jgi:hypothetical protein